MRKLFSSWINKKKIVHSYKIYPQFYVKITFFLFHSFFYSLLVLLYKHSLTFLQLLEFDACAVLVERTREMVNVL